MIIVMNKIIRKKHKVNNIIPLDLQICYKYIIFSWAVVGNAFNFTHAFNQEAEAGKSLCIWVQPVLQQLVPGQALKLHRKILSWQCFQAFILFHRHIHCHWTISQRNTVKRDCLSQYMRVEDWRWMPIIKKEICLFIYTRHKNTLKMD